MDTKLLFFDIDGTLFNEQTFEVSDSTRKAIKQAQENGHKCIINTGRPISTIDKVISDIPFDGYICGCGTYIEYQGKQILHAKLEESIRKMVIDQSIECHIISVFEGKDAVYFPKNLAHEETISIKERYIKENMPVFEYDKDDLVMFDKFAAWYEDESKIEQFKEKLSPYFEIIQRAPNFIEVVPLKYSKATGIQFLTDYLHNTIDNTISFGDSTNDLPMLTYTKESVAMGNSNPILFDKVTYITTDIDNDGIYNALKHFQII